MANLEDLKDDEKIALRVLRDKGLVRVADIYRMAELKNPREAVNLIDRLRDRGVIESSPATSNVEELLWMTVSVRTSELPSINRALAGAVKKA